MMRRIPLVMLCLLLCGCAQHAFPEAPDSPLPPAAEVRNLPEDAGGDVEKTPLNLTSVQGLRVFGTDLLLFSGEETTVLTLLDSSTLASSASSSLGFFLDSQDPSLRFHDDGSFSYHDPNENATILLDSSLTEIRRIPSPGAAVCAPILSDDADTLFYCTASHLRAWDLKTGIRRCLKELSSQHTQLTDVLLESTVLQCRNEDETLFLSSEDGRMLQRINGTVSLRTIVQQYYATLRLGHSDLYVFGQDGATPQMLIPEEAAEKALFLPECRKLLTSSIQSDNIRELALYNLDTGHRMISMALAANQKLLDGACIGPTVYLLIQQENRCILYRWRPQSLHGARFSHVYSCIPAKELPACQTASAALEEQYGIQILFGDEAAALAPSYLSIIPEDMGPLILDALTILEEKLAHFPPEILQQTAAHFSEVRLCLVRDWYQATPSILKTGHLILEEDTATILLPVGVLSGPELYRQLFHLMEIQIFSQSNAFDRWQELNPAGFQYDYDYDANTLRDSGIYLWGDSRVFVDTFSMSYPTEDRASIFACAMLPGQEDIFLSSTMQKKLHAVCTGIRESYNLTGSFLWEQYLQ